MQVRKTTLQDLPEVMNIYAGARIFMAEHGNPNQWGPTNWPPQALIEKDIAEGKSYVCVQDEQIAAVFFFTQGSHAEPGYDHIEDGAWIGGDTYGVVHRVASSGQVKGAGAFALNWAYEQAGHLRIDTHPDNTVMQGLLTRLGFQRCGIIHVEEDNFPRYAYERI